jgi:hypothetical protein
MGDISKAPDPSMSGDPICVPPPPDELDRLLSHVPLEDFGRRLQQAAQAVFPNDTKSRYTKVACPAPLLPVFGGTSGTCEISLNLSTTLRRKFWGIPSQNTHRALNGKIMEVVGLENDARDCLKIVY